MRRPTQQHEAPPPRVAAYCRYSTDTQNPRSVGDQLKLCQRYCERQGWPPLTPEAVFADEAVSGGIVQRTEYQRLLGLIATSNGKPPFDVILIEDFSRLTRQMTEMSRLRDAAPIWGVKVIDISTNTDITDDAALFKGIGNEQFLRDLRRRIRRGLSGRFEDGLSVGGTAFGYRSVPVPDPSGRRDRWGQPILLGHKLAVDPAQAAVVQRIYTEAAAGMSPRDIAHGLDRDGIAKPCRSYAMTKGAERTRTPWSSNTVRRILRNPRYTGRWQYQQTLSVGRHPDTGKKVMRPAPDGETLEQQREELRLIDDKTWHKIQDILDGRADGLKRDPTTGKLCGREKGFAPGQVFGKGTHALNGLLRCAICGGPFNVLRTTTDEKGRLVRSVGCLHHQRLKGHCANIGIVRLAAVEDALSVALIRHFSDFRLMVQHKARFDRALDEYRLRQSADETKARADLAAAEAEIAKVKHAILMGVVGDTTAAMLREAEAKQAEANKRLADAEEARLAEPRTVPPQEVLKGLNSLHQRERRDAYQRLLSEVRLTSHRAPGGKITDYWTAQIVAKPEAGITGLPKSVAFGKDGITVGRSASPLRTRTRRYPSLLFHEVAGAD